MINSGSVFLFRAVCRPSLRQGSYSISCRASRPKSLIPRFLKESLVLNALSRAAQGSSAWAVRYFPNNIVRLRSPYAASGRT